MSGARTEAELPRGVPSWSRGDAAEGHFGQLACGRELLLNSAAMLNSTAFTSVQQRSNGSIRQRIGHQFSMIVILLMFAARRF